MGVLPSLLIVYSGVLDGVEAPCASSTVLIDFDEVAIYSTITKALLRAFICSFFSSRSIEDGWHTVVISPRGPYNYDVLEGMTFGNISESFNADFEDGTIGEVWIFESILLGEYGEVMNIQVLAVAERSRPWELLCRCRGSAAAALSSGSVAAVLSSGSATAALWTVQIQMESGGEIQMDSGGDPDGLRRRDLEVKN
ncbi:hypothetical protein VPH35_048929 [Triticum aestivum]|uniref:Uncharacterized protein n=1 Tax=Triticum aestivum TaxID=4565 RepID=A0A077RPE2_WHEAT|nr:unnamed protein product [Triticum aestivum]